MSEIAKDYGVAWWTVHRILVATAVQTLGPEAPDFDDRHRRDPGS